MHPLNRYAHPAPSREFSPLGIHRLTAYENIDIRNIVDTQDEPAQHGRVFVQPMFKPGLGEESSPYDRCKDHVHLVFTVTAK